MREVLLSTEDIKTLLWLVKFELGVQNMIPDSTMKEELEELYERLLWYEPREVEENK